MSTMNLQAKKLELVQLILNTDRPNLLEKVSQILKQEEESDWWGELPLSVQESVRRGMEQAKRGETRPHSEVIRKYEKWL